MSVFNYVVVNCYVNNYTIKLLIRLLTVFSYPPDPAPPFDNLNFSKYATDSGGGGGPRRLFAQAAQNVFQSVAGLNCTATAAPVIVIRHVRRPICVLSTIPASHRQGNDVGTGPGCRRYKRCARTQKI